MSKPLIATLALVALSACTAQDERPYLGGGREMVTSGALQGRIRKGNWLEIGSYATISPTCKFVSVPRVVLTRRPQHGDVRIFRKPGAGGYGYEHCNHIEYNGVTLRYTPHKNFVGNDRFDYRVSFTNGEVRRLGVDVDVVDP
jgi:hypothetical protein